MALSDLTAHLQANTKNFTIGKSAKLYYNKYPNCLHIISNAAGTYSSMLKYRDASKKRNFRSRIECNSIKIFFDDFDKMLSLIKEVGIKKKQLYTLEIMTEKEQETAAEIVKNLPKARVKIVNSLPYKKYRYRIYWPSSSRVLRKIGSEAISAITHHINYNVNCRPLTKYESDKLNAMIWQSSQYFYSENEEILSIINLINPRFVSSIEKFVTRGEMDAISTDIDVA